ncbi:benenodin family lasso peptide [Novosphingobium gossypii]
MEREDTVTELGTASIETKGLLPNQNDVGIGSPQAGLSDD